MITLQIVDGSLQVSNNGSIILVAPKNSCAIDVLSLYDAIPLAVIYNKYLGTSTNIFTQPLANCVNAIGTPFSVNTFIDFAEANLGFDTVGGGCGGSSPFEYNANATGIQPILGSNNASGGLSTIGGGSDNTASGYHSTIGGGDCITITGDHSTIGGGLENTASGNCATIGGGRFNTASNSYATIGGGGGSYSLVGNKACGIGSTVSGGLNNKSLADYSTTSGGKSNTASGQSSMIGGGQNNTASNSYATIGGGGSNISSGIHSSIGGGCNNVSSGEKSTIGGGGNNTSCGNQSFIGGGLNNTSSGLYSTISGGSQNTASGTCSFIGGGYCNKIFPSLNDGTCPKISDVINGGQSNVINTNTYCTVSYAGGNTISGGLINVITPYSGGNTIGGGRGNVVNCDLSVIGGGFCNLSNGSWSSIVGGFQNSITCCSFSFIGGGKGNISNGDYSGILGGKCNNTNNYPCSMIVGNCITANRSNTTFVNDLSVSSMSACSGCSVKVSTNGLLITNNLSGAVHTFLKPAVGQSTNVSLNGTAISTIAGVVNKLTVSPFIPSQTITSASLYINVTITGIGSNARILIYSNLNGKPDTKIYESASLDCSVLGVKTATTVQTFVAGTTYWIGVQTSSTQTLSGISIASLTPIYLITNVMSTSLFITPAFGSAPTSFGSGTAQNLTVALVGITL